MRGIIFDLDGTLIDSYDAIAESLNHARAAFALPPLDGGQVRSLVGHGLETLVRDQLGERHVRRGVRLFREHYARICLARTHALPGVRTGLQELAARGYAMAVASNKPARFTEPILRTLDLRPFVREVQGPDRAGATKPDPAMLRACMAALRVDPADALYVGDMVLDVETAARAGLAVVLVAGGSSSREALRSTGHPVLDDFTALLELLP